ncbi:MAG: hypothetical protein O2822_07370, partial [Chloroflexi bacterium]|nr:hypothetical protein [Chloroflexota bacterium]
MSRTPLAVGLAAYIIFGGCLLIADTAYPQLDSESIIVWAAGGLGVLTAWAAWRTLQAASRQAEAAQRQVDSLDQQLTLTREQMKPQLNLLTGFDGATRKWVVHLRNRGPGRALELRFRAGMEPELSNETVVTEVRSIPEGVEMSPWQDLVASLRPTEHATLNLGPSGRTPTAGSLPIAIGDPAAHLFDLHTSHVGPPPTPRSAGRSSS